MPGNPAILAPGVGGASEREPVSVADAIAADIEALGELLGIEGSLAAIALKLGEAIDAADDARVLASLSREARSTLTDLVMSLNPRTPPREGAATPAASAGEVSDAAAADEFDGMEHPV